MPKQKRYYGGTYTDKYGNDCLTTSEGEGRGVLRALRNLIIRMGGSITSIFTTSSKEDLDKWVDEKKGEGYL